MLQPQVTAHIADCPSVGRQFLRLHVYGQQDVNVQVLIVVPSGIGPVQLGIGNFLLKDLVAGAADLAKNLHRLFGAPHRRSLPPRWPVVRQTAPEPSCGYPGPHGFNLAETRLKARSLSCRLRLSLNQLAISIAQLVSPVERDFTVVGHHLDTRQARWDGLSPRQAPSGDASGQQTP